MCLLLLYEISSKEKKMFICDIRRERERGWKKKEETGIKKIIFSYKRKNDDDSDDEPNDCLKLILT